jgi:pimeloyl-ACP methyl ester carboxylesterase
MNTALGTGDVPIGEGFLQWRAFNNTRPDLNVPDLMARSSPILSKEECAAYGAPFPDVSYKGGVRRFPNLVPDHPDAEGAEVSRRAREWWRTQWQGKSFMAIGMKDPVLGPTVMKVMQRLIKNCPPPLEIAEGGHFVQEWGEQIATAALKSFAES